MKQAWRDQYGSRQVSRGAGENVAHRIMLAASNGLDDLVVIRTLGRLNLQQLAPGSLAGRVLRASTPPVLPGSSAERANARKLKETAYRDAAA
jgi:nucleotide-binding universal stress UspA family protein